MQEESPQSTSFDFGRIINKCTLCYPNLRVEFSLFQLRAPPPKKFFPRAVFCYHTRGSLSAEKFRASICLGSWHKKWGFPINWSRHSNFVFLFPHLVRTRVWGQLRLLHWLATSHDKKPSNETPCATRGPQTLARTRLTLVSNPYADSQAS